MGIDLTAISKEDTLCFISWLNKKGYYIYKSEDGKRVFSEGCSQVEDDTIKDLLEEHWSEELSGI